MTKATAPVPSGGVLSATSCHTAPGPGDTAVPSLAEHLRSVGAVRHARLQVLPGQLEEGPGISLIPQVILMQVATDHTEKLA